MIYQNLRSIAIIMAVYNGERFVGEQIDSIIAQTNADWTLYIRDDCSTDNSLSIIKEYAQRDDRIIVVDNKGENMGCRNNFFKLLEVVDSEYYMFSDDDDVWLPGKIQKFVDVMRQAESTAGDRPVVVHSSCAITDGKLNVVVDDLWSSRHYDPHKYYCYNLISLANPVCGADSMFNRRMKELIFPLKQNRLLHDRWLQMVAAKNNAVFVPIFEPTRLYRQHKDNVYGVRIGKKEAGLLETLMTNKETYRKLHEAGYGSWLKYIYYKLRYMYKLKH